MTGSLQSNSTSKPLPRPCRLGWLAIQTARIRDDIRRRLRHSKWVPSAAWHVTVAGGAALATTVLLANLALLFVALQSPVDPSTGSRVLMSGSCDSQQVFSNIALLGINILSTLLLGSSNIAMQSLIAPTRAAVDKAHAKHQWLDIGISGFRNWPSMDNWRKWCWVTLMLSSVPLHLLYNSAIFRTASVNEYYAIAVAPDFIDVGVSELPNNPKLGAEASPPSADLLNSLWEMARNDSLKRVDAAACIFAYDGGPPVDQVSNVLMVTRNDRENGSIHRFYHHYPIFKLRERYTPAVADWICGHYDEDPPRCNYDRRQELSGNWTIPFTLHERLTIDHCLVQETTPQCTLQLIPEIMAIVIGCNIIKIACFALTVLTRDFEPLITLGDALSSFLQRPDPYTRGLGPLSAAEVQSSHERAMLDRMMAHRSHKTANQAEALVLASKNWSIGREYRFAGASSLRWGLTYSMCGLLWLFGLVVFIVAGPSAGSLTDQWNFGFGNIYAPSLLDFTRFYPTVANILIANAPQLFMSLVYLSFNSLMTCILLSREFGQFAHARNSLRVTQPRGFQRSSYFLSLPYRYAIPLLLFSALLHWGLAQALFLAEIKSYSPTGQIDADRSIGCLGFSTLGMMLTLIFSAVLLIAPLLLGLKRYPSAAPLLGSNSLAMSAACHSDKHTQPSDLLRYGALSDNHFCLTSRVTTRLDEGEQYAKREEATEKHHQAPSWNKILSRRDRSIAILIDTLTLAKLAVLISVLYTDLKLSGPFYFQIAYHILAPFSIAFVVLRATVSMVRWRRRMWMRILGWHVYPELAFISIWIVMLVITFHDLILLRYFTSWSREPVPHHAFFWGPIVVVSLSIVSTCLEIRLWASQYRLCRPKKLADEAQSTEVQSHGDFKPSRPSEANQ